MGSGEATAQVSLLDISLGTGLSKRAVQEALRLLAKRRLLSIQRESITAIPVYAVLRPWMRAPPHDTFYFGLGNVTSKGE